jgi:hypothetical protein
MVILFGLKKQVGFGLRNDRAQVYVNPYGKIYLVTAQSMIHAIMIISILALEVP